MKMSSGYPKLYFKYFCSICIFIIHTFSNLYSQIITGSIYDAGTRLPIDSAFVEIAETKRNCFSDISGTFMMMNNISSITTKNGIIGTIACNENTLYWMFDSTISFELFSIDGKLFIKTKECSSQGSLIVPDLPNGFYPLLIKTGGKSTTMVLLSMNHSLSVSKLIKGDFTDLGTNDSSLSLSISKDEYYTRKISIPNNDTLIRINILKKSYDSLDYFNELIDYNAYSMMQSNPSVTYHGDVETVKMIYDIVQDSVYYTNTKKYPSHYLFATHILHNTLNSMDFFYRNYTNNPDRRYYCIEIGYYKSIQKYVFSFFPTDGATCQDIELAYRKIKETSYIDDILFYATRSDWEQCSSIPTINTDQLYNGQNYQALNIAENYGYLRKINYDTLNNTYLGRRDIVLLNNIPNEVSLVAGIITTEFQTPLSHINVLSHNRGTPNMALRDGWTSIKIDTLINKLVYLSVGQDSFIIRIATNAEADSFWNARDPHDSIYLNQDTITQGLIDLQNADYSYTDKIGAKAANFAELLNIDVSGSPIPVPEGSFAIPFYYYVQHLSQSGLNTYISSMLTDSAFKYNYLIRQAKLAALRDSIINYPLDSNLFKLVKTELNVFPVFSKFRFRSSTNAEDIEVFNGAGLYDSYTGENSSDSDDVMNAIKKVWASMWNYSAFEEREYFLINHHTVSMGILVHRSYSNEDANGVIITKNLYNINPGFIVNTQYKEYSIVKPDPGIMHDQIIIYSLSTIPGQKYTIEYLLHSNLPELNGKTVLTDAELFMIGDYCTAIKDHYFYQVPHSCSCSYKEFSLDIEFKLDSEVQPRKIYIKQVRPYK